MLTYLRPALVFMLAFTVVTGLVYPLAITGVAQLALAGKANGSLIKKGDTVIGSSLIGQSFSSERYFHGRPSATSGPDPADASKTVDAPYNASNSAGSNLGPTSKKLIERVEADVAALRKAGIGGIPADAVTTSASGLDPHVSPEFAERQVARIAAARKVPAEKIRSLLAAHVDNPVAGIIGEPRVNVLELNLALDAALADGAG
jgi:K+-transporting ATPase ATPase C chain